MPFPLLAAIPAAMHGILGGIAGAIGIGVGSRALKSVFGEAQDQANANAIYQMKRDQAEAMRKSESERKAQEIQFQLFH